MSKIVFEDVFLKYEGAGDHSLFDVSFSIEKGETVGVIGSTGSGKTSLVSMIPGFYPATSGTVLVDDKDVREWKRDELLSKIGFCFQKYYLFRGTIKDNVAFGAGNVSDDDIKEALSMAQALDFVEKKPEGVMAPVSEMGSNLSGGQKQRIMIARALVRKPDILILDDSSSALDFQTDRRLREELEKVTDMTKIIVSQRVAVTCRADRIIVLEDGRVAGMGSHETLLRENEVYREIYESQTRS